MVDENKPSDTEDKPEEKSSDTPKTKKPTAKEMKAENDAVEVELKRTEDINARMALGGQSEAGQIQKEKTDDEKWSEEAKKRYEGTGMDPTEDNTPTQFT